MLKNAAIALVFGFIGAAIYGRISPPQSPYDYIAVAKYTDAQGRVLPTAQIRLINRRATQMAKDGFIILNQDSMYAYPKELMIPQTITETTN